MFYDGGLQNGIALAMQQSKDVLCFVHGHSQKSQEWEDVLTKDEAISAHLQQKTICLRLKPVSLETQQLSTFCPVKTTPSVVVIHNGAVQLNVQSSTADTQELRVQLRRALGLDATTPSSHTASAALAPQVHASQQRSSPPVPVVPSAASLAAAVTQPQSNSVETSSNRQGQISEYVRLQKEREQKQKAERERIKQQIKADREERKQLEQRRKQPEMLETASTPGDVASTSTKARDVRIQVRMFDGSSKRHTFLPTATVSDDIRPWIDSSSGENVPYNLRLILTPLPNRNIEAAEEEQSLADLGVVGSGTFVMVPVKGYVDSYTASAPGAVSSTLSGGYNLLTGTAGALFGGVRSMLGYRDHDRSHTVPTVADDTTRTNAAPSMRLRTLADHRAEEAKRDQQFYNGNQLNFEPRRDEDSSGT